MASHAKSHKVCNCYRWERRLESHDGVECVVRVCPDCGRRELCWSRRGLSPEAAEAFRAGTARQGGRKFARG